MKKDRYELTFQGSAGAEYFPRYKRFHDTPESAQAEAKRVAGELDRVHDWQGGTPGGSHNPQIYGPDGSVHTIKWP